MLLYKLYRTDVGPRWCSQEQPIASAVRRGILLVCAFPRENRHDMESPGATQESKTAGLSLVANLCTAIQPAARRRSLEAGLIEYVLLNAA